MSRLHTGAMRVLIGEIVGRVPVRYRAPAFSINRSVLWAYDVLAELGFRYDSSQYDSPRIPNRIRPVPRFPYLLELPSGHSLWELPIATRRVAGRPFPVGGGSYWRLLPRVALVRALRTLAAEGIDFDPSDSVRCHHYPTLPSRLTEISFCASTANSIGSCWITSLTKPLTTSATASSSSRPRLRQ